MNSFFGLVLASSERRLARFCGVEDVVVGTVEVVGKAVVGVFAAFWKGHVGFGVVGQPCIALHFAGRETTGIY